MIQRAWQTWVAIWDHREHPRTLAILRILVGAVLLFDIVQVGALGLVEELWAPHALGGFGVLDGREYVAWYWRLMPWEPWTVWLLYALLVLSAAGLTTGTFTRTSAWVLLLSYATTAETLDAADRGIDMMLRNVVMLLAFSRAGDFWSVDAWRRTGRFTGTGEDVPAWPRHLLVLQLVVMYFIAGVAKVGSDWTPMAGFTALYVILQDPAVARFDWSWLAHPVPYFLTRLSTGVTILWEYSAPLVLVMYWFRHTWDRGGALRTFVVRYRLHWWWLLVGVIFHVLIAISLNLGIFPFAMLALYPAFVHPSEWWFAPASPPKEAPGAA